MACHDAELSILFTNDKHIAELNRRYLGRKGPTNVLAFPMSDGPAPDGDFGMLGDIVLSVDRAIHESKELDEPLDETIYRLLIHGLLHLLNYDHERSPEEARRMEKEQRRLLGLMKEG
ncbi:MAG: rRNA maturation RNase YbeY [Deltaproteobacteria bacterium]|nr:MAG: rRNA maturation RNase YbeY [Deltaproteobacteria bacterium]